MRRFIWLVLALAAVALMAVGLHRGEWAFVKGHADTLCLSCIGLTTDYEP